MASASQILVRCNGEEMQLPPGMTVAELIARLAISVPRYAVEINRDVVPRAHHAQTTVQDGDEINIVTLVGGG